jgi:uncharacterized protein YggE
VSEKDINSANLRTQPDYDYQNGKSILKGYRAVRTVEVTCVSWISSTAAGWRAESGSERNPFRFAGRCATGAYKDEARKAAIDDAIHQAQQLASGFTASWARFTACATTSLTISRARWFG